MGTRPRDGVRAVRASQRAAEEGRLLGIPVAQFRPSGFFSDEVGESMESFNTQVQLQAVSYDLEKAQAELKTAARSDDGQGAEAATKQAAALLVSKRGYNCRPLSLPGPLISPRVTCVVVSTDILIRYDTCTVRLTISQSCIW